MQLYLDTSCIVKLFLNETDSDYVRKGLHSATLLATSVLSYVEMHSAINRRQREKTLTSAEARRIHDVFELDWTHYFKIEVNEPLLRLAAQLTKRYALRSYDAIHLASAIDLLKHQAGEIVFLTADIKLQKAAQAEHLLIHL